MLFFVVIVFLNYVNLVKKNIAKGPVRFVELLNLTTFPVIVDTLYRQLLTTKIILNIEESAILD